MHYQKILKYFYFYGEQQRMFESHLTDVSKFCISKTNPEVIGTQRDRAASVLAYYMANQISFEECYQRVADIIGDGSSASYVKYIIELSDLAKFSNKDRRKMLFMNFNSRQPMNKDNKKHKKNPHNLSRSTAKNWSQAEDDRLLSAIIKFGLFSWHEVARFVGYGRTKAQCSQRWSRGLDPSIYKGPWSEKDDRKLLKLVDKYGEHAWKQIASCIGNRSDAQCRYRYTILLRDKFKNDVKSNFNSDGGLFDNVESNESSSPFELEQTKNRINEVCTIEESQIPKKIKKDIESEIKQSAAPNNNELKNLQTNNEKSDIKVDDDVMKIFGEKCPELYDCFVNDWCNCDQNSFKRWDLESCFIYQ